TIANHPKFLCPIGSGGLPFIPPGVYQLAYGLPLIITEGPVKALACLQAGIAAIGLNGVWCAAVKNSRDLYVIRSGLQSVFDWRGRKVYICFDVDCSINPNVREALVRLFFILSTVGAEVYQ